MNNPFHRAAIKAFEDLYIHLVEMCPIEVRDKIDHREFKRQFAASLEAQAKAFDACKSGTEISMANLMREMSKALAVYRKRIRLDGNHLAAEGEFNQHMKPHFEIRLW